MEVLRARDKLPWTYGRRQRLGRTNRFDIWTDKNESSIIVGISAPLKEWLKAADTSSLPVLRLPELVCRISILQGTLCPRVWQDFSIESALKIKGMDGVLWDALGKATQHAAARQLQVSSHSSALEQVVKESVQTDWMVRVLRTHYKLIDPPQLYYFVITTTKQRLLISAVADTWLESDVRIAAGGVENITDIVPANQEFVGLDPKKERLPYNQLIDRVLHILEVIKQQEDPKHPYDWIIKVDDDTYVRKSAVLYDLVKVGDSPIGVLRGRKYCGYVKLAAVYYFPNGSYITAHRPCIAIFVIVAAQFIP